MHSRSLLFAKVMRWLALCVLALGALGVHARAMPNAPLEKLAVESTVCTLAQGAQVLDAPGENASLYGECVSGTTINPYKYVDPDGRHPVLAAIGFLATRAMLWLAERQAVAILAAETTAAVATGAVVPSVALEGAVAKTVAREVTLSRAVHGEAAVHAGDAIRAGQPSVLTIERSGAAANRSQSIGGLEKVPGKHLDEYPPAMFKEGGTGASVRAINPRDNMSGGACIGNACRGLPDGAQVRIKVTD